MMFSKDDLLDMFEKIKDQIRSSMNKEIGYFLNMNAIMVQLLLHDAEKQNNTLQVEVSQIENIQNMKEMNDFVASLTELTFDSNVSKLKSIGKLGSVSSIENLIKDNETLKKLEKESQEAKQKLDEQIEKYKVLLSNFDKKVSESAQFKTLKKILQDKNTLIVELKTKVAKLEKKE